MTVRLGPTTSLEESWVRSAVGGLSNANLPLVMEIVGPLDERALRRAVRDVTRRHEALRTAYDLDGTVRLVLDDYQADVPMVDVSAGADPERDAERLILGDVGTLTDVTAHPLWRAYVLRLTPRRHWLAIVCHHAIFDGWSAAVMARDITRCYRARVDGREPPLAPLTVHPSAYAEAQLAAQVPQETVEFWRGRLPGSPQRLPLGPLPDGGGVMANAPLPPISATSMTSLMEVAERAGASRGNAVRAAALATLAPYLGDGVILGALVTGRMDHASHDLVGVFADHDLCRVDMADDPPFCELVSRVHTASAVAKRHPVPYSLLRRTLDPQLPASVLHVSVMNLPASHREPIPVRVCDDPLTEISVVPINLDGHRPMGRPGCPGITPISYTLRHDKRGAGGEVWGCAVAVGASAVAFVPRLQQMAAAFSATVERIARAPEAKVRQLSAAE